MYTYLLTTIEHNKNLAQDDRPDLLNFIRQDIRLTDCQVTVSPKQKFELDESNIMFHLIQARLNALRFLCLTIEQIRANTIMRPPFLNDRFEISSTLYWKTLAQTYDIDLDLLAKEQNLIEDYRNDVCMKSIIFFHHFCKKIVHAGSLKEVEVIRTQIPQYKILSITNAM